MKRTALFLFAVALSMIAVPLPSEEAPYTAFPRALGVTYAPISGTGLHYHLWRGTLGLHVAGGVVYLPPGQAFLGTTLDYTVGAAVQRRVYGDRFSGWLTGSLYVFAGASHRGYIPLVPDPALDPEDPSYWGSFGPGPFVAEVTSGIGIGIEIILFNHISVPVEFGYGATWRMTEPVLSEAFLVQLYAQTALRYRY